MGGMNRLVACCLLTGWLAGCGGAAPAASSRAASAAASASAKPAASLRHVKVGFATIVGINSIVYVMSDGGILQKHGIDADINFTKDGPTTITTLLSGDIQFAMQSDPSITQSHLEGSDAEWIGISTHKPNVVMWSQPSIDSIEGLKGKKIGVTTLGSYTALIGAYTLKQHGLDPKKDVQMIAVGGGPEAIAALQNGQIDAIIQAPEPAIAGKKILYDYTKGDLFFPQGGLAAKKSWVDQNQALVTDFLAAYQEAVTRFKSDQTLGEQAVKKLLKLDDPAAIHQAYVEASGAMSGEVTPGTKELQTVLDLLADSNPKAAGAKPADLFDDSFAKKAQATS
jgi:NitT/TauT family transport system substrate-binding protein